MAKVLLANNPKADVNAKDKVSFRKRDCKMVVGCMIFNVDFGLIVIACVTYVAAFSWYIHI